MVKTKKYFYGPYTYTQCLFRMSIIFIPVFATTVYVSWHQPDDWLAFLGCIYLFMGFITRENLKAYKKKVMELPSFTIDDNSITEYVNSKEIVYALCEIDNVSTFGPFQGENKRPGFVVNFKNGSQITIFQMLNGYEDFFSFLSALGISGTENGLPVYDRLNKWGMHIDIRESSHNSYGAPLYVFKPHSQTPKKS